MKIIDITVIMKEVNKKLWLPEDQVTKIAAIKQIITIANKFLR